MAVFLDDEWLDAYRVAAGDRPGGTGPDGDAVAGTVRVTVEKAPQGKVVWIETITDGRVTAMARAGAKDPADVELTAPHPLAVELWRDGLDPAVAFMQGRLKMRGDSGLWMRLLPTLRGPAYTVALSDLAADTEF